MLSRTAEHALRAVLVLADRNGGRALPAGEIAELLGVPRNYLAKTLQRLVRSGVLQSVRGPGGGFRLVRDPCDLPISAVLSEFDPVEPVDHCLLGYQSCDAGNPCAAHDRWTAWSRELSRLLDHTTIGHLLADCDGEAVATGNGGVGVSGKRTVKRER